MKQVYIAKPDRRLTVKEIYEDFRKWVVEKYDVKTWNKMSQRQVYTALKQFPEYPYVRFKEGFCLKGITHREEKTDVNAEIKTVPYLTLNILDIPNSNVINCDKTQLEEILQGRSIYTPTSRACGLLEPIVPLNKRQEFPIISESNQTMRVQHVCPRVQGVILPTLGQKTNKK